MKEKETNVISVLKKSAQWDGKTARQKAVIVWFDLSLIMLMFCGSNIIAAVIAIVNFMNAARLLVRYAPNEEDEE